MALTWTTILAGAAVGFGMPTAVILLNRWRRHAGWLLCFGVAVFIIVGNAVEQLSLSPSDDRKIDYREL